MTKELGALLRKKSWTGDEVGKAILYSLVDAHRQGLEGVASPTPVFSSDQLQRMISSLSDSLQFRRYNSYVGLQNWLIQYQAVSTAYFKQAVGELDMIGGVLKSAQAVEADLQTLDSLPVLLTRKQYDDLVAQRIREQLVDEAGNERTYSLWRALVLAATYWCVELEFYPENENPLATLRDTYRAQPVASRRILDAYAGAGRPSKWDILCEGRLHAYYPAMSGTDPEGFLEQVREFYEEFQALCGLMLRDVDRALLAGASAFTRLSPESWGGPVCSVRVLYDQDIYNMKELIEGDRAVFQFDEQVRRKGYAIIGNEFEDLVDARRYSKALDTALQISVKCGLEQYTALNPDRGQAVARLADGRRTVENGYYYVKGYDKAIALIADYLRMPEFLIFKLGAEALEERMRKVEKKVEDLRERVSRGRYGKEDAREAKLAVLSGCFPPFDWDRLEIPPIAIEAARGLLTDNLRAFDKQDSVFISILTSREGRP